MAAKTYLAGDLGGTKTFLALYRDVEGQLEQAHSHRYVSAEWRDLESMLSHFLKEAPEDLSKPDTSWPTSFVVSRWRFANASTHQSYSCGKNGDNPSCRSQV